MFLFSSRVYSLQSAKNEHHAEICKVSAVYSFSPVFVTPICLLPIFPKGLFSNVRYRVKESEKFQVRNWCLGSTLSLLEQTG